MEKYKILPAHIYIWPTNGHVHYTDSVKLTQLPYTIHNHDGSIKEKVGLINATIHELKKCTKEEAYAACWKFGGYDNWYDCINLVYAEKMIDSRGKPVDLDHLLEFKNKWSDINPFTKPFNELMIEVWKKEHFEYVQNPIYREFMINCGWKQEFVDY